MTDNNIKLIKLREAADMLGVNPETLRRWDKQGILKAVRVGRRKDRRYHLDDIKKFAQFKAREGGK